MKSVCATKRCSCLLVTVGALIGCGAPQFSVASPPMLDPGRFSPPAVPEPQPVRSAVSESPDVNVVVHKTRDVPDLRGRLVALTRLAGDPGTAARLEDEMTLRFVDRGVARLLPGSALAEVRAGVDRAEAGAKGSNVKLSAPLGVLALVADASGAEYVLYGDIVPGSRTEEREVKFEIPAEDLATYEENYGTYVRAVDASRARVEATCADAASAYEDAMEEFTRKGGRPGPEKGAPSKALQAQHEYAQFRNACQATLASLEAARGSVPTPGALEADAAKRKQTTTAGYTAVQAVVKVRDAKSDETFWIGRFDARGANLEVTLGKLADRVVAELSSGWGTERPPEADAGRTDPPARRRP